ncbi:LysR family transcriptional regulator [Bradyrhizobium sp. Pear76]|uniref:LysR family transcriptional regulator n=1 Tax=Bradyrhizobium oropedii TaxID=1571201 RepID=UPI001E5923D3|nr:LysR family transcriptional regulator [Bradyrhizobium oropedii]MCC8961608.1 LysR family transcriptional regulator [Bradyrhizobium oropedii]
MPSDPGMPTLDQLRVFLTVVEAGSFAAAARKLNRATSVVSYAIANLESQLGVSLFDRESTRKPQLTQAGVTVLAEARTVTDSTDKLRAKVKGLLQGLEAEVHIVLNVMLPTERVVDALTAFSARFPTVALRLHIEALGGVMQLVVDRTAIVGISGLLPGIEGMAGIGRVYVGDVKLLPVAAVHHPLAVAKKNKPGAARDHVQLVLSDRSQLTKSKDFGVVGLSTWRLADLGSKHSLLKAGIGWGYMPRPMVREDLDSGRLVRLNLPDAQEGSYRLEAVYRTDAPPGPAASSTLIFIR